MNIGQRRQGKTRNTRKITEHTELPTSNSVFFPFVPRSHQNKLRYEGKTHNELRNFSNWSYGLDGSLFCVHSFSLKPPFSQRLEKTKNFLDVGKTSSIFRLCIYEFLCVISSYVDLHFYEKMFLRL